MKETEKRTIAIVSKRHNLKMIKFKSKWLL